MSTIASNRCIALLEAYADRILARFSKPRTMQPRDIEKRMCRAIDEGARVFRTKVYAPNSITVTLNPQDMKEILKYRKVFREELNRTARDYVEANMSMSGNLGNRIAIKVVDDASVPAGEAECTAELVDDLPAEEGL